MRASSSLLAALLLFVATPAFAKQKVQVTDVKGSIAFMVEGSIRNALKKQKSVELVTSGAAVIVTASADRSAKGWVAEISVRSGDKVLKSWKAKAKEIRKLSTAIEKGLWKNLGPTITKATPAAASAGEGDESEEGDEFDTPKGGEITKAQPRTTPKTPGAGKSRSNDISKIGKEEESTSAAIEEEEEEPAAKTETAKIESTPSTEKSASSASTAVETKPRSAHTRSNSPVLVTLGLNYFTRSLRYKDDLFGELRPYTLGGAPAPVLDLVLYPAGFVTDGIAAHLGLNLHVEYALALKSKDSMGREFPTSELELEGGLRGRIPFSGHEVALSAGMGVHNFSIDNASDNTDPDVPAVSYTFLRIGLDARFAIIDALNVTLSGAYRPVLASGEISEANWFSRSSASAIDAGVSIAYAVIPSVDIILGGSMRRYFYTLNPEPGDVRVAGGALDQYLSGTLAIGWHLE